MCHPAIIHFNHCYFSTLSNKTDIYFNYITNRMDSEQKLCLCSIVKKCEAISIPQNIMPKQGYTHFYVLCLIMRVLLIFAKYLFLTIIFSNKMNEHFSFAIADILLFRG